MENTAIKSTGRDQHGGKSRRSLMPVLMPVFARPNHPQAEAQPQRPQPLEQIDIDKPQTMVILSHPGPK